MAGVLSLQRDVEDHFESEDETLFPFRILLVSSPARIFELIQNLEKELLKSILERSHDMLLIRPSAM